MAVAPVAVEMGPRSKRRLRTGAIVLGVAAVAWAGLLLFFGRANQNSHNGNTAGEVYGTFGSFGIPSGSTSKEVLARLGPPDQKRGGCWIYRVNGDTFHGTKILPQIAGIDAVRYCFFGGDVVSTVEDHWRPVNGRDPYPHPWMAPMVFGCGGQACVARP